MSENNGRTEKDEKPNENEDPDDIDEDDDDEDEIDYDADDKNEEGESKPQNAVQKQINKQKRRIKKQKDKIKSFYARVLQVVIFFVFVIVVLSWSGIEKMLIWASGQEEITVISKTIDNGCYEIITADSSYCLDEDSFDMAVEGQNFLIDEYEGYHILRSVDRHGLQLIDKER